jgi:hypothetical protein
MDYDGLMIKYKYRASPVLTEDERANQLHQNEKVDLGDNKVMDDAAVIHLSSGYMEVVDKWYAIKGFLTVPSLALFLLFTWGVYDFTSTMYMSTYPGVREIFFWGFGTGAVIIFLLAWFCSFMLRVECFRWTHYPVRFDRKNRLVHVFSVDGEVYSAPGTTFSLRLDVIQKQDLSGRITIFADMCWRKIAKRC